MLRELEGRKGGWGGFAERDKLLEEKKILQEGWLPLKFNVKGAGGHEKQQLRYGCHTRLTLKLPDFSLTFF